jgi:hypothetical protein
MSKHVPVSLWIPGNRKGDFGNDGEDERKKNEPDRRASSVAMTTPADHQSRFFHTLEGGNPGIETIKVF